MKKATVYILALVLLLGCFAGCRRSDPMEEVPTPAPTATARPSATVRPAPTPNTNNDDGQVNDNNGIIEDNDGNVVTPDKDEDIPLDNDILDGDLMDDNTAPGMMTTPNPSAATDSNSESRARTRK